VVRSRARPVRKSQGAIVNNCGNCRYWIRYANGTGGECSRVGGSNLASIVSDDDLAVLFTDDEFSCSMHEPRPSAAGALGSVGVQKLIQFSVIELPGGRKFRVRGNSLEVLLDSPTKEPCDASTR
jgi:hypothetical protein